MTVWRICGFTAASKVQEILRNITCPELQKRPIYAYTVLPEVWHTEPVITVYPNLCRLYQPMQFFNIPVPGHCPRKTFWELFPPRPEKERYLEGSHTSYDARFFLGRTPKKNDRGQTEVLA